MIDVIILHRCSVISRQHLFVNFHTMYMTGVCIKPLILRHSEQILTRPVSVMRRLQLEQFRALLKVEETNVAVRDERVTTAPPSLLTGVCQASIDSDFK